MFDLDGTLLSVNSFPHWVRALLRIGGLTGLRTAILLLRRKAFRMSHARFKKQAQRLWADAVTQPAEAILTQTLLTHLRPELRNLLQTLHDRGAATLLATAAAAEYALPLGAALGFRHVLATTPHGATPWEENSREAKCRRVLEWQQAQGYGGRPLVFFTDHEEDLPLLRCTTITFWLGPETELARIQEKEPDRRIVFCRGMAAEKILGFMP